MQSHPVTIAIPNSFAKSIDVLAERVGMNRSELVRDALDEFIKDFLHLKEQMENPDFLQEVLSS